MGRVTSDFDDSRVDANSASSAAFGEAAGWHLPPTGLAPGKRAAVLSATLAHVFERDMAARRGFLWLPVAFAIGVLGYFALPSEPSSLALAALTAALAAAAWRSRFRIVALRVLIVAAMVAAGATAAKVRTDLVAAPMLDRDVTLTVTGWIAGLEETPEGGRRLTIRVHHIDDLWSAEPHAVRITIRSRADVHVGDGVSVLARLGPPSGPVQPGAYDFASAAFYERLGAYGFALGPVRPASLGTPPLDILLSMPVAAVREAIRARVEAALAGDKGHIAAALIMGDQNGIADQTQEEMRASGLGHVLSISGLHMVLVAGSVFWLLRALLALSPALALRRPIKKWAAAVALAVSAAYLAISGAAVATERSFIMLAIMLGAILLGRRALTLRNVALAALLVMLFRPESVLSASFQMSFAATAALVAAYEAIAERQEARLAERGHPIVEWLKRHAVAAVLTSLVAGLATLPFGIYHFQRVAPLTLVANLAAMPAISLVVMPMALAAVILMPFGLESLPLAAMAWGLDWMNTVAAQTAAWTAGYGSIPSISAWSLLIAVSGFLWLILWRERWRLLGLAPLVLAVPLAAATAHPDIILNEEGTAAAVRADDGRLRILGSDAFTVANWLRADGDARSTDDASLRQGVSCDRLGCVTMLPDGRLLSLVLRPEAFADDCRRAAMILSAFDAPSACAARATVIDGDDLRAGGAHGLYREGAGYRVETAYPAGGARRPFMPPQQN